MKQLALPALLLALLLPLGQPQAERDVPQTGSVVLLHGLARTDRSFRKMERALRDAGYAACNVAYPSTAHSIEKLAADFVLPEIRKCFGEAPQQPLDFVTHSMGGIIARELDRKQALHFGRVVMLSPPNKGSEVVDTLGDWWLFKKINGPAGGELGTAEASTPNRLGRPSFSLGVITGDKSINWILSTMIKGEDDGKVSVESARLDGMADFLVIPATHPFIMKNKTAIRQVLHFLKHGRFEKPEQEIFRQDAKSQRNINQKLFFTAREEYGSK